MTGRLQNRVALVMGAGSSGPGGGNGKASALTFARARVSSDSTVPLWSCGVPLAGSDIIDCATSGLQQTQNCQQNINDCRKGTMRSRGLGVSVSAVGVAPSLALPDLVCKGHHHPSTARMPF